MSLCDAIYPREIASGQIYSIWHYPPIGEAGGWLSLLIFWMMQLPHRQGRGGYCLDGTRWRSCVMRSVYIVAVVSAAGADDKNRQN